MNASTIDALADRVQALEEVPILGIFFSLIESSKDFLIAIQEIPVIGEFVSRSMFMVFFIPPLIVSGLILNPIYAILGSFAEMAKPYLPPLPEDMLSVATLVALSPALIIVFGAILVWLRYFERSMHLSVFMPIPIIKIPWMVPAGIGFSLGLVIASPVLFSIWLLTKLAERIYSVIFKTKANEKIEKLTTHPTQSVSATRADLHQSTANPVVSEDKSPSKDPRSKIIIGGMTAVMLCLVCSAGLLFAAPGLNAAATETAIAQATADHIVQATSTAEAQARDAYIKSMVAKSQLIFGPENGKTKSSTDSNNVSLNESVNEELSDFIATATFQNPYSTTKGSWSYGFIFRVSKDYTYYLWIDSDKKWVLGKNKLEQVSDINTGDVDSIDTSDNGKNTISIFCEGSKGLLFVNDVFISKLDLSEHTNSGFIFIGSGFTSAELTGFETAYEEFIVRKLP